MTKKKNKKSGLPIVKDAREDIPMEKPECKRMHFGECLLTFLVTLVILFTVVVIISGIHDIPIGFEQEIVAYAERIVSIDKCSGDFIVLWEKPQRSSKKIEDYFCQPSTKLWLCSSYDEIPKSLFVDKNFKLKIRYSLSYLEKGKIEIKSIRKLD